MKNKNTVYLTQEGLDNLKKELDDLINVRRPENVQAIKEARALGDLSENAEYDAARNEQAVIEARIKQLEKMLENVSIISDVSTDSVSIGNTVTIKYVDDDEEDEYKIVGSQEADPFESRISNESPIAQALFDHKVGATVFLPISAIISALSLESRASVYRMAAALSPSMEPKLPWPSTSI